MKANFIRRIFNNLANSSPWLVFLPFLLLYAFLSQTMSPHDTLILDEGRYWQFAENLLHGHYHGYVVGTEGYQFLWNGPGYPIFLTPFVALGSPLWLVKLMNAGLLYLAVIFLFKMLNLYVSRSKSLFVAGIFAAYFPMYAESLPFIMTEALAIALTTLATFLLCCAFRYKDFRFKTLLLAGFTFAMLALTKVLIGYVLLVMLVLAGASWLLLGKKEKLFHIGKVFAIALVFCMPYLTYTYAITGKAFYWGNAGGLQLYWMSSPHAEELGDWHSPTLNENPLQHKYHDAFFASLEGLGPVERDAAFKKKALENIKQHPKKWLYNWIANWGRTFFSHPLSFLQPSNGLFMYLVPNIFLIVFSVIMGIASFLHPKRFPTELLVMVIFVAVYLFGTSLLASYVRFLFPVIPILLVWIAYGLNRFVTVDFSPKGELHTQVSAPK